MLMRSDAVKILLAAGMTKLQATQFLGNKSAIKIDAVCHVLRTHSMEAK